MKKAWFLVFFIFSFQSMLSAHGSKDAFTPLFQAAGLALAFGYGVAKFFEDKPQEAMDYPSVYTRNKVRFVPKPAKASLPLSSCAKTRRRMPNQTDAKRLARTFGNALRRFARP